MTFTPGFTGSPLSRHEQERHDPAALARFLDDPLALLLDLMEYMPGIADDRLAWRPLGETPRDDGPRRAGTADDEVVVGP